MYNIEAYNITTPSCRRISESTHLVKLRLLVFFLIGLSDFVMLLICWPSTLASEWTVHTLLFQRVTLFSLVLSIATLFAVGLGKNLLSDPLTIRAPEH